MRVVLVLLSEPRVPWLLSNRVAREPHRLCAGVSRGHTPRSEQTAVPVRAARLEASMEASSASATPQQNDDGMTI